MPAPIDPKAARASLGLSHAQMARALGLSGGADWRRIERGDAGMAGPARRLLDVLLDPRCPEWVKVPE